ncbi:MAG: DUF1449 family protein [Desulfobacteraceae bacterium]|nr:MAG: DUF1449 family protein [Desulfobacteraceae bacterium]
MTVIPTQAPGIWCCFGLLQSGTGARDYDTGHEWILSCTRRFDALRSMRTQRFSTPQPDHRGGTLENEIARSRLFCTGGAMTELLQWWNLIFILPFVGALFYILMLGAGVVAGDHGAELNVDMDHDSGLEHLHDIEPGMLARALSFFGIGRVPLSIILVSICFLWGFAGFASNTLLEPILPSILFVWVSIAIALLVSVGFTRMLAVLLARIMPATETYAVSLEQLAGKWGEAVTTIDDTFGQAHVHDDAGVLHTVPCLVRGGEAKIERGTQVILLFFDKTHKAFLVGTDMPALKKAV